MKNMGNSVQKTSNDAKIIHVSPKNVSKNESKIGSNTIGSKNGTNNGTNYGSRIGTRNTSTQKSSQTNQPIQPIQPIQTKQPKKVTQQLEQILENKAAPQRSQNNKKEDSKFLQGFKEHEMKRDSKEIDSSLYALLPSTEVILNQAFNIFDIDQDGIISLKDLEASLKILSPNEFDMSELKVILYQLNEKGEITFPDFSRIMTMDESTYNNFMKHSDQVSPNKERGSLYKHRMSVYELGKHLEMEKISELIGSGGGFSTLKRSNSLDGKHFNTYEKQFQEMKDAFNMIDRDKKGYLVANDLINIMTLLGFTAVENDAISLIQLIGKENKNDPITLKDFIQIYTKCQETVSIPSQVIETQIQTSDINQKNKKSSPSPSKKVSNSKAGISIKQGATKTKTKTK